MQLEDRVNSVEEALILWSFLAANEDNDYLKARIGSENKRVVDRLFSEVVYTKFGSIFGRVNELSGNQRIKISPEILASHSDSYSDIIDIINKVIVHTDENSFGYASFGEIEVKDTKWKVTNKPPLPYINLMIDSLREMKSEIHNFLKTPKSSQ